MACADLYGRALQDLPSYLIGGTRFGLYSITLGLSLSLSGVGHGWILLLAHCTDPIGGQKCPGGRSLVQIVRETSWVQGGTAMEDSFLTWKTLASLMVLWSSGYVYRDFPLLR
jgi:hypothetical protein